jgi:chromosomal replication initiator protein
MHNLNDIWNTVLDDVKGNINTPTFKTWFEPIKPVSFEKNTLTVSVNSHFAKEWLESRHIDLLLGSARKAADPSTKLKIVVDAGTSNRTYESYEDEFSLPEIEPVQTTDTASVDFNKKYSFDTFVMGSSNRFSCTAALAVSEKPGKTYNPLFIYGGVGLGKTHLLHAIGQYVLKLYPKLIVKYVSAEKFLNDFINALRYKNIISFKESYRNNDVLLVDDIQFLEEKEASQEEFFHTFNALHGTNKQIVLSSDRSPKDLSTLEDRLRSRFEWGLVTDIQPPDLETRIAIIKKYCEREKLSVPEDILNLIAEKITLNIRELEGAVTRIVAFSSLTGSQPDMALAIQVLKDIIPDGEDIKITNQRIIKEVSRYFSIPISTLISSKRSAYIAHSRQLAMYLCREHTSDSLLAIGRAFGNRDHATVLYAVSKINERISKDPEVYKQVQELTNRIKSNS